MATVELVVEAGHHPRLREALIELWAFRGTALAFAERTIRVKYAQAALGVGWAVVQPLAFMTVFTLALGRVVPVPGDERSYAAFSLAVLVAWTFLQTTVSFGSNALLTEASILHKVYFPRELPIIGAALAGVVDFGVGLVLFAVLGPFLGAVVSPTWVLAPLLGLGLGVLATAVALLLAALTAYYRDFRHALPFFLQLWLFASPVAYPLTVVPDRWRWAYLLANPAAGYLDGFRRVLALGTLPDPGVLTLSVVSTAVITLAAYHIFKRLEPNFAEVT